MIYLWMYVSGNIENIGEIFEPVFWLNLTVSSNSTAKIDTVDKKLSIHLVKTASP